MEELIPTIQEEGEERIDTVQEGSIIAGVQTINGKAGDLNIKTINGQDILTPGDLSLATTAQLDTKQDALTETQLIAVDSGIDSTKVEQIATNAENITTLQNTKQDNLTQTQLNAVNSGIDETKVAQISTNTENITSNTNRITSIEGKIPSAATSDNQLTDKNYVDNSIATNTANYISDNGQPFQSLADLEAYSGPLTNNDYAFVVSTDAAGNLLYTRYKYNADQQLWAEEYTIANPTFTSTQWAAIDSGVTANDVTQIGTNKSDIASLQSGKQDALSQTQLDAVNSGINATKVQQIADNTTAIGTKQDKLVAGTNIQIASDGKTVSATDTTYTAGTGLTLTGTQFSVTEPVPNGFFSDTTATQEGEGTTITLSNTITAPLSDVKLKGDSSQQTYPGKSILGNTVDAIKALAINNGTWSGNAYTKNGVTYTLNVNNGMIESISLSGTASANSNLFLTDDTPADFLTKVQEGQNYTLSGCPSGGSTSSYYLRIQEQPYKQLFTDTGNSVSKSMPTLSSGATAVRFVIGIDSGTDTTGLVYKPMLESGSSPTSFEPYVGGITSPNPDFPQDIDVVTGTQTAIVSDSGSNSQTYTIRLGSLELVKIGSYQDYIWNDGGTWKKHKEIDKILFDGDASENWYLSAGPPARFRYENVPNIVLQSYEASAAPVAYTKYFKGDNWYNLYQNGVTNIICSHDSVHRIAISAPQFTSVALFKTWLSSHNMTVYYAMDTTTDETITDADLISDLDAFLASKTYSQQTNYSNSATSPDLPAILTIDVFKDNYAGLMARLNKAGA